MSKTISTISLSQYVLTSTGNPLSITTVGGVETNGGTAIYGGSAQAWTVSNSGDVSAGSAAGSIGIDLKAGGTINNTGSISGSHYAIRIHGTAGTVTNAGSITSQADGVVLFAGGSVSNAAGGVIAGTGNVGVYISGGAGTVTNAGTISGTPAAVQFVGNYADRVILDPGAVLNGRVQGGSGSNTLEVAQGDGTTGTLSGFATSFTGFGTITIDVGATWQFDSTDTIGSSVLLTDPGTLGNAGLIDTTVTVAGGGSLDNTATIDAGSAQFGVTLPAGGVVSNIGTEALIEGSRYGIRAAAAAATVSNSGTILGASSANGGGVGLYAGGTVTNTGTIIGSGGNAYGVYVGGGLGTVINSGTIIGGGFGVGIRGGAVSNSGGIFGGFNGVLLGHGGTAINTGTIDGRTGDGVYVSNAAGTVTNAGTIGGGGDAVRFAGAFADRVILDPGAVFQGKVVGGSGSNVLELATGTTAATGTLSGFPTSFTGFGTITIDAGAAWQFDSSDTIGSGMLLTDAGTLGNAGLIDTTVTVAGGGSLDNTATIDAGSAQFGVTLPAGGVVSNIGTEALIEGSRYGIRAAGAAATVSNSGTILGASSANGGGVGLYAGGTVTNTGTIIGSGGNAYGVYVGGGLGTVINSGTIIGGGFGVGIRGGAVSNSGGIFGGFNGVLLGHGGTAINTGTIDGRTGDGVYVSNAAGTVTNAGTIGGGGDAVRFAGAFADRVILDPGAVFHGKVAGGSGSNTLELAAGTTAATGTLSGFGASFTGFGTITIDAGASWRFDATDTLGAGISLTTAGTLLFSQAAGSSLTVAATISGPGKVEQSGPGTLVLDGTDDFTGGLIIAGGTLELSAGNAAGSGPIDFAGDPTLRLDGTIMPTGTISGLALGDAIDLAGVTYASGGSATIINSNTLQVIENSATYDLTLDPHQDFSNFSFNPTQDASTGTLITVDPACYCRGTRILTIRGEIAVEHLRTGDHLVTLSGASRPVRWIGRRHLDLARHPTPDRVRPIRIRANAFADAVPHRDLLLSPDHAVRLDGVLVAVRLLVNGASIVRDTRPRTVTYYHVELDAHDLLLAENLAAESYLDTGNRGVFENAGGVIVLHPDLGNGQARRAAESCVPFVDDPARTEPFWRMLAARAAQLGWQLPPEPEITGDPDMRLMVDARAVSPASVVQGRHMFVVPRAGAVLRLMSRSAVPSDAAPWAGDERHLGVMLGGLTVRSGALVLPIPLDHPAFGTGWWQPEWHGPTALRRWTDGDALVPMPDTALLEPGPCLLEVVIAGTVRYPLLGLRCKQTARQGWPICTPEAVRPVMPPARRAQF